MEAKIQFAMEIALLNYAGEFSRQDFDDVWKDRLSENV